MTDTTGAPARPTLAGLETTWARRWQEEGTYTFDRSADRVRVYAIDTPPPTVSGSLHIGHVFSYSQTDMIARYRRMRGHAVFYPIGWDDNGLATERRVQNVYGVRCDPSLAPDPGFVAPPPGQPFDPPRPLSRPDFVALCARLTAQDERAFEQLWRYVGLSVDWSLGYTTIGARARTAAQRAFLRNLARGEAYLAQAPTLWDVSFQTAVAQAEVEDRELPGALHRLRFTGPGGAALDVDTTRPELLGACVALVCHQGDHRYAHLAGGTATVPWYGHEVPVRTHRLADPATGTGLVMVCTFGDLTDVTWWRELDLPTRTVIGRDGRLLAGAGPELAGLAVPAARRAAVAMLRGHGALIGEPRSLTHAVKFYEKGDAPLEIVSSRQWYVRNGGRGNDLRDRLLALGRELGWTPGHMARRYEHWVAGLAGDWLVSRQRFFGVPIPVWYPLDEAGRPGYDTPLLPRPEDLPVDPASQPPPGYDESTRDTPGGFAADPDVFDTWMTSTLTPQIAAGWERDPDLFARVFPMHLRPQSHEIIRTWLFGTVLRAHLEHGVLPWRQAVIAGWILDRDRKKMAKSVGNVVTPMGLLQRYGADGVRYWAGCARPGVDATVDETQMRVGRRLATKILNVSRFVLGLPAGPGDPAVPLDLSLLAELSTVVDAATAAFEAYDHTGALVAADTFFWAFCDDYVELVKERAYGGDASAVATLRLALSVQLRLFAPVLPYVTEEVWSWWRTGSVHRAAWPTPAELAVPAGLATAGPAGDRAGTGDPAVFAATRTALTVLRRAKSDRHLSLRAELGTVRLAGPAATMAAVRPALDDLRRAVHAGELVLAEAAELAAELATDPA